MNTQTILAIAAKHSAYADSRVCVRGQDDILAFAKEVLATPTIDLSSQVLAPTADEQCDDYAGLPQA